MCMFDPGNPAPGQVTAGGHLTAVDHTDTTPTAEMEHT